MSWRIFSILLAVTLAFTPLIIDSNTREYWPIYVAFISLVWVFLSEQITEGRKNTSSFEGLLVEIRSQSDDCPSIIKFDNSQKARAYIGANASLCTAIYNTRVGSYALERDDPHLERVKKAQDEAIKRSIAGGCDYHIIYDEGYIEQCDNLRSWYVNKGNSGFGRLVTKVVKASDYPLMQFTVLDFGTRKEALIGWVVSDKMLVVQDIFLVRSDRLASYFIRLFRVYSELNNGSR